MSMVKGYKRHPIFEGSERQLPNGSYKEKFIHSSNVIQNSIMRYPTIR